MMYTKYLQILEKWCTRVFYEMTNTEVVKTTIKKDERHLTEFAVAKIVEYEHLDKVLKGNFILGINNKAMAVLVASSIAEHMGLQPVTEFDEYAEDILGEFLNTVVGRTIAEWDQSGLPVRFSPPVSLKDLTSESANLVPSEPYMIVLSLPVSHIVLGVTFNEPPAKQPRIHRILLVDDSSLIRKLLKKALEEGGFEAEEAKDGLEAIEKHKSFNPDLTIMDLVMPEMGGLDAIMEIKQKKPEAKFIVMTSTSRKDEIVTAKTLGVLEYIIKPLKLSDFLSTVRRVLE